MKLIGLSILFMTCVTARAQLAVTVSPPKLASQKAVILLAMTNNLTAPVESARAVCFLLDEQGKMVGQSTKWVIGNTKSRVALEPNQGTDFNFVITSAQPFTTTNLATQVSFNKIVLAGGRPANLQHDVTIMVKK